MTRDTYQSRYMDAAAPLYAEKHVARVFAALFGVVGALAFAGALAILVTPGAPAVGALGPLFAATVVTLTGLYFAVMRTTVTAAHVTVQYGTMGPRIPVAAITACGIEEHVGLGPKYHLDGWRYAPMGTQRGVRLRWTDGGEERSCYIGAQDADALLAAVERARAGASASGVRAAPERAAEETLAEPEARTNADRARGTR